MEKVDKKRILNDDEYAINWLMEKIEDGKHKTFSKIADKLLKYAQKTLDDLKNKDFSNIEMNKEDLKSIIGTVQRRLKDEKFAKKCEVNGSKNKDYSLNTLTEEELKKIKELDEGKIEEILKSSAKDDKELIGKIIQVNRFYNMQLKYAHTAKTVYVAEEMLDKMDIKNKNVEEIILTSAVLHDVGRFYQALEYDAFTENVFNNDEIFNEIGITDNSEKDHAAAGYFYAMMNLFEMNDLSDDLSDKETMTTLISAFVVRFHQKSNSQMQSFDMPTDLDMGMLSLADFQETFVDYIYENSPLLDINEKHKKYIRDALEEILQQKMPEQKEGMETIINDIMNKIGEDFLKDFSEFFKENKEGRKAEKELPELIEKLMDLLEEELKIEISGREEKKYAKIIKSKIKEMIDYDVAEGVCNIFENNANIEGDNKHTKENNIMDLRYNLIKKYYKLYQISKTDEFKDQDQDIVENFFEELKQIEKIKMEMKPSINEYKVIFAFPLNCITDADKVEIWNQRAQGTFPTAYKPKNLQIIISEDMEYEEFFEELGITDEKEKEKIINSYKEANKKNKGEDLKVVDGIFNKNLVVSVPEKYAYENYYEEKEDKKVEALITKDDQENFYKYDGMERKAQGTVRALLWTINQFIFTNTRTKSALEIIKENNFLERTYQNYSEGIKEVLKPYMQYALYYIDEMIKYDSEIFNAKIMEEQCEKIYMKYQGLSKEEKQQYAERLDRNRNREDEEEFNY